MGPSLFSAAQPLLDQLIGQKWAPGQMGPVRCLNLGIRMRRAWSVKHGSGKVTDLLRRHAWDPGLRERKETRVLREAWRRDGRSWALPEGLLS